MLMRTFFVTSLACLSLCGALLPAEAEDYGGCTLKNHGNGVYEFPSCGPYSWGGALSEFRAKVNADIVAVSSFSGVSGPHQLIVVVRKK